MRRAREEVAKLTAQVAIAQSKVSELSFVSERLRVENKGPPGVAGPMGRDGREGARGERGERGAEANRGGPRPPSPPGPWTNRRSPRRLSCRMVARAQCFI